MKMFFKISLFTILFFTSNILFALKDESANPFQKQHNSQINKEVLNKFQFVKPTLEKNSFEQKNDNSFPKSNILIETNHKVVYTSIENAIKFVVLQQNENLSNPALLLLYPFHNFF